MQLTELISAIQTTHEYTQRFAVQQANVALTIRNWVIGFYIVEYEQQGSDKAMYGDRVMKELASRLKHIKGISEPQLYRFREFYVSYPQILSTALRILQGVDFQRDEVKLSLPSVFSLMLEKLATGPNIPMEPDQSCSPELLLPRLSFSHFIELIRADTPLKRAFYEVQAIKNNWSVRELGRAMSTLLFERTGLSTNKASVIGKVKDKIPVTPAEQGLQPLRQRGQEGRGMMGALAWSRPQPLKGSLSGPVHNHLNINRIRPLRINSPLGVGGAAGQKLR